MTTEEAKQAKEVVESQIADLLNGLETTTGYKIASIYIEDKQQETTTGEYVTVGRMVNISLEL